MLNEPRDEDWEVNTTVTVDPREIVCELDNEKSFELIKFIEESIGDVEFLEEVFNYFLKEYFNQLLESVDCDEKNAVEFDKKVLKLKREIKKLEKSKSEIQEKKLEE